MGFFSWDCKVCGESMKTGDDWMGLVTIVSDDGSMVRGMYDGYGRVQTRMGEMDLTESEGRFACYHATCYALAGNPAYDGPSGSADDQGCGESEIEPRTLAEIEDIKSRRAKRTAEDRAALQRFMAERRAECVSTGKPIPEWLR
jgi:hypothetical protein